MEKGLVENWKAARRSLVAYLALLGVAGAAFSFWKWGLPQALTSAIAALCLALGFWITEMLIGVFTGIKRANATAIAMLFLGKLVWWGGIFIGARHLPVGHDGAVAIGLGIFLLAVLLASLRHYGIPRISDAENPRDP